MKTLALIASLLIGFTSCQSADNSSTTASTSETTETTETPQTPAEQKPTVQTLKQADLAAKMAEENVVVIDVRTPGEVSEGYITGANLFIDFYGENFQSEILKLDKSKTYVMYCRSGGRSGQASLFMVNNGFNNVYNLAGGIGGYTGTLAK